VCTQALIDPHGTPSKCKALGLLTLDHFTCWYIYPCVLMQALNSSKQALTIENAYKQTMIIKNEKSKSSCMNEVFGHKK
jgi:hypothetical protein